MSISSITNTDWTPTITLVETEGVASAVVQQMNSILRETKSPMTIEGREYSDSLYYRDETTTLPDGTVILPYIGPQFWDTKRHPFLEEEICMLLPHDNFLFLYKSKQKPYGTTIQEDELPPDQYPMRDNVQTKQGRCAIEGANCFIANTPRGCKALIGNGGLAATRVALEHQGYYRKHRAHLERLINEIDPTTDDYYRARNVDKVAALLSLHTNLLRRNQYSDDVLIKVNTEYRTSVIAPLTSTEIEELRLNAKREAAKMLLAKQEISKEYNVPLSNMAFVPNFAGHLDYNYAVSSEDGVVVLHDDTEVLKMYSSDTDYGNNAHENLQRGSGKLTQMAIQEIRRIGMIPVLVAGQFHRDGGKYPFNMINGLFIKGTDETIFFTNDTSVQKDWKFNTEPTDRKLEALFAKHFLEKMQAVLPKRHFRVIYMNTGAATDYFGAGLHCYTTEKGKPRKTLQSRSVTDAQDFKKAIAQLDQWGAYRYMNQEMPLDYRWTIYNIDTLLHSPSKKCHMVIAEDENQVLQGMALIRMDSSSVTLEQIITAPFNQPYIDPANRNKMYGAGSSLMKSIAATVRQMGLPLFVVAPRHLLDFFTKNGFVPSSNTEAALPSNEPLHMTWFGQTTEPSDTKDRKGNE